MSRAKNEEIRRAWQAGVDQITRKLKDGYDDVSEKKSKHNNISADVSSGIVNFKGLTSAQINELFKGFYQDVLGCTNFEQLEGKIYKLGEEIHIKFTAQILEKKALNFPNGYTGTYEQLARALWYQSNCYLIKNEGYLEGNWHPSEAKQRLQPREGKELTIARQKPNEVKKKSDEAILIIKNNVKPLQDVIDKYKENDKFKETTVNIGSFKRSILPVVRQQGSCVAL